MDEYENDFRIIFDDDLSFNSYDWLIFESQQEDQMPLDENSFLIWKDYENQQTYNEMPNNLDHTTNNHLEYPNQQHQSSNEDQKDIHIQQYANNIQLYFKGTKYLPLNKKPCSSTLLSQKRICKKNTDSDSKLSITQEDEVIIFKKEFYGIFTNKRKFRKTYVKKIHDIIRTKFCFRAITREEFRSIDLYFQHYAFYRESIISFLRNNYHLIITKYPELNRL